MALQVWLPLTKDLRNQGLSNVTVTNNGATFNSAGKLGGCYKTSSTATIDLGYDGNQVNSGSLSFGGWFKFNKAELWSVMSSYNYTSTRTTPTGNLIGNNSYGGVSLQWYTNNIYNDSNLTTLYVQGYLRSTTNGARATSGVSLPFDTWVHIFFTFDKLSKVMTVWLNGEAKYTFTNLEFTDAVSKNLLVNYNAVAGGNGPSFNIPFLINDVRIYDHCLSPMEVKQISQGLVLHYPLNRNGWGQENLATQYVVPGNNGPLVTTTAGRTVYYGKYGITIPTTENADTYFSIYMKQALESGKKYTLSCEVNGLSNGTYYNFPLFAQNNSSMGLLKLDHNGLCSLTFTMNYTGTVVTSTVDGVTLYRLFMDDISRSIASGQGAITVTNIKLEEGDKVTPWCPASIDSSYTTMGLNGTTEYDCSGFCNNGTKNNISYTSDTPKYAVSSVFNGSNSYIKVNDNNWMIKGMSEMTVNLWAKATTWPTNGGRLLSCTESGGFNLEGGNSGYWRFSIYVYTNSGQTSSAYKYDSNEIKIADLIPDEWNMITLVYDNTGTKTYLNGVLHHTYTNTSYGINFNTNARLFLGCEANTASPYAPYFNGKESDFRIYATALSASDVKSLYQNCATIDPDGTIRGKIR